MEKHSLSHTSWECVYHVVWIPKYRRKVLYGETRREIGEILRMLVDHMDGVEIVEGSACPDHIHICLRIAPKHSDDSRTDSHRIIMLSGQADNYLCCHGIISLFCSAQFATDALSAVANQNAVFL